MSRIVDLLLVCLVGGLAWWLFLARTGDDVDASEPAEVPRAVALEGVDETGRAAEREPSAAAAGEGDAGAAESPALGRLAFAADDARILAHPQLTFLLQREGAATWRAVEPAIDGDACTLAGLEPGRWSLAVALALPAPEVLRWIDGVRVAPGAASDLPDEQLAEGRLALGALLHRVRLDARDVEGRALDAARLRWPAPPWNSAFAEDPWLLCADDEGKVLLPRRAGTRVQVVCGELSAIVKDPSDGQTVVLGETPR